MNSKGSWSTYAEKLRELTKCTTMSRKLSKTG